MAGTMHSPSCMTSSSSPTGRGAEPGFSASDSDCSSVLLPGIVDPQAVGGDPAIGGKCRNHIDLASGYSRIHQRTVHTDPLPEIKTVAACEHTPFRSVEKLVIPAQNHSGSVARQVTDGADGQLFGPPFA